MFDWWDGYFKTRQQLKFWRNRHALLSALHEKEGRIAQRNCKAWRIMAEKLEEENFTLRKVICSVSDDKLIAAYNKLKPETKT